jgi:hypothetical protein
MLVEVDRKRSRPSLLDRRGVYFLQQPEALHAFIACDYAHPHETDLLIGEHYQQVVERLRYKMA